MGMLAPRSLFHRSLFHKEHSQPLAAKLTPSLKHSLWQATDHSTCLCSVCLLIKTAAFSFKEPSAGAAHQHETRSRCNSQTFNLQVHFETSSSTSGEHSCPRTLRGDGWKSIGGKEEGISSLKRRGLKKLINLRQQDPTRRLVEKVT